ncbi:MAG: hypothetical protein AVDCRST_MAG62-1546 [uncultured Sphingomonas sp.]|uniref:Uncharacterized protein n=1 Tax=uncultured Sphingomonas sp. TaxID=158754 RepID=A0A6J4TM39_9SPHN|nr:MAG: hypothetical protein AVDCRST_MAG62-1546 [uncultured Sphingomonas sp.]
MLIDLAGPLGGHIAHASTRKTRGKNAGEVDESNAYATEHNVDLRTVELDVLGLEHERRRRSSAAVETVLRGKGQIRISASAFIAAHCRAFRPPRRVGRNRVRFNFDVATLQRPRALVEEDCESTLVDPVRVSRINGSVLKPAPSASCADKLLTGLVSRASFSPSTAETLEA